MDARRLPGYLAAEGRHCRSNNFSKNATIIRCSYGLALETTKAIWLISNRLAKELLLIPNSQAAI